VIGIGTRAIMNPPVDHVEVGEACSHGALKNYKAVAAVPGDWLPWNYEHALAHNDQRHAQAG
jgi:hypothetical protein